jgi:two-component system chemotaxis sensor kinase CheA
VFGIVVDGIYDTEEIVVKPVAPILKSIPFYSGNTILGDGSVVLIVEPNGLARIAGIGDDTERTSRILSDGVTVDAAEETGMKMLLFRAGKTLTAVPISAVSRLEDIDMARIETLSGKNVLQYGGHLMPVVVLDGLDAAGDQVKPCIVLSWGEVSVGIFADEIMDVVDEALDIDQSLARPGIVGSAILRDRTIEVLDVIHHLLESAPRLGRKSAGALAESRVLLIEPSAFFRDTIGPFLRSHGLDVTTTDTLTTALSLVASGRSWGTVLVSADLPGGKAADAVIALRDAMQAKSFRAFLTTATVSAANVAPCFAASLSKFDHDAILAAILGKGTELREAA